MMQLCITFYVLVIGSETSSSKKQMFFKKLDSDGNFLVLVENFLLLRKGRKDGRKRRGGKEGKARESSFIFQRCKRYLLIHWQ